MNLLTFPPLFLSVVQHSWHSFYTQQAGLCDHSLPLPPHWVPQMPIYSSERQWFTSASQSTLNWAGTVIQLDAGYFLLTRPSFELHYVSSHQRPFFLKRVFLVWLANHSSCTALDHCLQSTGIEFSHPGMKSSVFDGHTQSGVAVCSKWAFVNLCC